VLHSTDEVLDYLIHLCYVKGCFEFVNKPSFFTEERTMRRAGFVRNHEVDMPDFVSHFSGEKSGISLFNLSEKLGL